MVHPIFTRTHGRCAVSGRGAHGCPTDTPKIPNSQVKGEIAANEIMQQGLASPPESPYGAVTCEEGSASIPSVIYRLKSAPIWHTSTCRPGRSNRPEFGTTRTGLPQLMVRSAASSG